MSRLARGTVNMEGDRRFPDHYCFCSQWDRTLTPRSVTLSDEVLGGEDGVHYSPRAWCVHYSDVLRFPFSFLLYHSLVLLFSPPYSVRNILIQILNVLNDATRVYKGGGRIHSQGFLSWYSWVRSATHAGIRLFSAVNMPTGVLMRVFSLTVHVTDGRLLVCWSGLLSRGFSLSFPLMTCTDYLSTSAAASL